MIKYILLLLFLIYMIFLGWVSYKNWFFNGMLFMLFFVGLPLIIEFIILFLIKSLFLKSIFTILIILIWNTSLAISSLDFEPSSIGYDLISQLLVSWGIFIFSYIPLLIIQILKRLNVMRFIRNNFYID